MRQLCYQSMRNWNQRIRVEWGAWEGYQPTYEELKLTTLPAFFVADLSYQPTHEELKPHILQLANLKSYQATNEELKR